MQTKSAVKKITLENLQIFLQIDIL